MKIKNRIRQARELKGWSQTKLARKLGHKTSSSVSEYESSKRIPDLVTIFKLADLLDVSIDRLFYIEEE